jgi:hypothetical protein
MRYFLPSIACDYAATINFYSPLHSKISEWQDVHFRARKVAIFFVHQAQKMEINTICPAWCLANGISVELSGEIC